MYLTTLRIIAATSEKVHRYLKLSRKVSILQENAYARLEKIHRKADSGGAA